MEETEKIGNTNCLVLRISFWNKTASTVSQSDLKKKKKRETAKQIEECYSQNICSYSELCCASFSTKIC